MNRPDALTPRAVVTLAYLVAVLVLGGASAAGFGANLFLQIAGAGLVAWTLWARTAAPAAPSGLRRFAIALGVLAAVQFLPLPPALWRLLPGRETVAHGFELLDLPVPWLTLSLAPWHSLGSLTWCIPAAALFLALRAAGAPGTRAVILTIGAVAAISAVLGGMQRGSGIGYIYQITNYGEGPGFFANSNHQGSFLLTALALWTGHLIARRQTARSRRGLVWSGPEPVILGGVALALLAGVLVSGSLACVALLIPVCGALALIARPDWRISLPMAVLAVVLVLGAFTAFLLLGPIANDLTAKSSTAGISRQEFLLTGSRILADFAPLGSGLGTFQELYRWYETPGLVGTTFVNHAHDDLLELLIETGVFGLAAVATFVWWFAARAWQLWSGARDHPVALAASVAIGAELLHSLVDYPLRTAAMSSIMAVVCVLLIRPAEAQPSSGRRRSDDPAAPRDLVRI